MILAALTNVLKRRSLTTCLCLLFLFLGKVQAEDQLADPWQQYFAKTDTWQKKQDALENTPQSQALESASHFGDSIVTLQYRFVKSHPAKILLLGRYGYDIQQALANKPAKDTHKLELWFRTVRFDDARNKLEPAMIVKVMLDGQLLEKNIIFPNVDADSLYDWEQPNARHFLTPLDSTLQISDFRVQRADFSALVYSAQEQKSNLDQLVDYVQLGEQHFKDFGCAECHAVKAGDTAVKSGPNLFGLFQERPREIEIIEGGEGHHFSLKADHQYLINSLREPQYQIAIGREGAYKGKAYQPIMPPYNEQILTNRQLTAIGAWLQTLNTAWNQGAVVNLQPESGPQEYLPMEDPFLLLVGERTRIQRGPMPGTSARAIHVGLTNGVNYSFDPRRLAVVKLWQGGFLNMEGEFRHRGGRGLEPGFKARELRFSGNEYLLAPVDKKGNTLDFSFKEAKFQDQETIAKSLNSKRDHAEMLADIDAQFLGYSLDSSVPNADPQFAYRVGKNTLNIGFRVDPNGNAEFLLSGKIRETQRFLINTEMLTDVEVSVGEIKDAEWKIAKGTKSARLKATINLTDSPWFADKTGFSFLSQKLDKRTGDSKARLPEGYAVEDIYPPKDNFGREQLFEALGLAQAKDGTVVVATRTAGIWRLKDDQWHFFAEGTFDSLGVVVEDKHGLVLTVGQKAELTRIADTNGDGIADSYKTLFDAFSYHGNYHTYLHGPVKTQDNNYLINLNLAHADDAFGAGGAYMGTYGGYAGWALLVDEKGNYDMFASGLRSPAGLGKSPDGRLWYTDNQGEYLGTSKMFVYKKHAFYSHPAGLIDKPKMQPDSPEITWDKVKDKRKAATILFPHNRLANSPGHLEWDTTEGKFGAFAGQAFIGDQTQSTLMRITLEEANDVEQGAVIPFAANLASGVMRPLFLQDGSLLLGQTGRGWRAQGGEVTSLQRIVWDGSSQASEILDVNIHANGFLVNFTRAITSVDASALSVESWRYRDASDYGSPELDMRKEEIKKFEIVNNGKSVLIELAKVEDKQIHPEQTARIYYIRFKREALFPGSDQRELEAFYTVNAWPAAN